MNGWEDELVPVAPEPSLHYRCNTIGAPPCPTNEHPGHSYTVGCLLCDGCCAAETGRLLGSRVFGAGSPRPNTRIGTVVEGPRSFTAPVVVVKWDDGEWTEELVEELWPARGAGRIVTKAQASAVLERVAQWLGPRMGYSGAAPTGRDAAWRGSGPMLNAAWDWGGESRPTILLEGGPDDWALLVSADPEVCAWARRRGLFLEPYAPYAGYALCIYVEEGS